MLNLRRCIIGSRQIGRALLIAGAGTGWKLELGVCLESRESTAVHKPKLINARQGSTATSAFKVWSRVQNAQRSRLSIPPSRKNMGRLW